MAERTVTACPDCNSTQLRYRTGTEVPDWWCADCGHRCDEPVERAPTRTGPSADRVLAGLEETG